MNILNLILYIAIAFSIGTLIGILLTVFGITTSKESELKAENERLENELKQIKISYNRLTANKPNEQKCECNNTLEQH